MKSSNLRSCSRLFLCLLLGGLICALMAWTGGVFAGPLPQDEEETPTPIAPTPTSQALPPESAEVGAQADRTVGSGCTYATIAAAVAAANPGDRLLIEGGVTFNENIVINKNIIIEGGYAGCASGSSNSTTVNGGGTGPVFEIANNTVTLRNLNITNGRYANGGGVRVLQSSQVTLDNVDVYSNQATGNGGGAYINPGGVLTLTNSSKIRHNTAGLNGGGVRVWGKLVVSNWNSSIEHNSAPNGGGLSVTGSSGVAELVPCHVRDNQATGAAGRGGGIHVNGGARVSVTGSSSISDNSAYDGAGIYADHATVNLLAVIHSNTAANHGGGIYLANGSTLVANNTSIGYAQASWGDNQATNGAGGGLYVQNSTVSFTGYIYNNRAATQGGGLFAESSTITLTDAYVGGTGANQANDVTGGVFGAGLYLSATHALLSHTVVASNTFSSGAGWGGGIVAWNGSVLTLTDNSRVEYHYAPNAYLFGGAGAGLLVYSSTATLDNSQVLSNTADIGGGGIYMLQTSILNVLNGSVIANNHALNGPGGAIVAEDAPDINISNATLRDNSADTDGGAIYIDAGTLDFTGSWTLRQNTAGGSGGALAVLGTAEANLRAGGYCLVYFNRAQGGHGGMVYLGNNTTTRLYATTGFQMYIYANRASGNGGALYADNGGYFDVYGQVNFDRNRADNGGAIYVSSGSRVWLDDYVYVAPQLWDNWADDGSGGAIYASNSPRVKCDGAVFGQTDDGNHASVSGGAIYLSGSTFDADNCILQGNEARQNGGAIAAYTSTIKIYANFVSTTLLASDDLRSSVTSQSTGCNPAAGPCSALFGNTADSDANDSGDGGAIYVNDSTLTLVQTHLHRNSAYRGGAIYQTGASAAAQVSNSLIYSNTVSYSLGAGIRRSDGAFTLSHVTIANNVGGSGFSGLASVVTNTIAWGNEAGGFTMTPTLALCNIDDRGNAGLNVDPLFVAPGAGENYSLRSGSPAIDACAMGLPSDLDGVPRPFGSAYDMGAYEYHRNEIYLPLVLRNHAY